MHTVPAHSPERSHVSSRAAGAPLLDVKSCESGEFSDQGALRGTDGHPITIDGLWSLAFGNGSMAGPTTTLFFTAGPNGEHNGLFGSRTAVQHPEDHEHGPNEEMD